MRILIADKGVTQQSPKHSPSQSPAEVLTAGNDAGKTQNSGRKHSWEKKIEQNR